MDTLMDSATTSLLCGAASASTWLP